MAEDNVEIINTVEEGRIKIRANFPWMTWTYTLSETIAPDEVTELQLTAEMVEFMVSGKPLRRSVSYGVRDALLAGTRRRQ